MRRDAEAIVSYKEWQPSERAKFNIILSPLAKLSCSLPHMHSLSIFITVVCKKDVKFEAVVLRPIPARRVDDNLLTWPAACVVQTRGFFLTL